MRAIKKALLTIISFAAFGAMTSANAAIIDTVLRDPDVFISVANPFKTVHDITDDGFTFGVDTLASATIRVRLTDEAKGGNEDYRVVIGNPLVNGFQQMIGRNVQNNTRDQPPGNNETYVDFILSALSLTDLNADGKIDLRVFSTDNSFYFAESTLTAQLNEIKAPAETDVPEPFTLALMGVGLLGLGAARRKAAR